jgi:Tfp pilus assembly PilM family ATPase
MHIISIDIGSYSIKFLESLVEKKSTTHIAMKEIVLEQYIEQKEHIDLNLLRNIQFEIIQKYIKDISTDHKLIIQYPKSLHTTRFLNLPIKQKKKAELMIPFQLEDDIPLSLMDAHFAYTIQTEGNSNKAFVEITSNEEISSFYQNLSESNIYPNILTTENSAFATYFNHQEITGSYMVLDFGHQKTSAHLFVNNQLLATHISFIAGQSIDEAIASTYNISADESIIYKHQNCFVLSEEQYESVDEKQKQFARLMDHVLKPLINDIQRWELGFKVTHGLSIDKILLCGGSSNIKNITHYLTSKLAIPTEHLNVFDQTNFRDVDSDDRFRRRFTLAHCMAASYKKKKELINLLKGAFAQKSSDELPLHSIAYIASRAAVICGLIAIFFSVENFLLRRDIKELDKKIANAIKNPTLNFNPRERRTLTSTPKVALEKIKKQHKNVIQEIKTVQSALNINSVQPLIRLGQLAKNSPAELTLFKVDETGFVEATFHHKELAVLESLQNLIIAGNLPDVFYDLSPNELELKVEFKNRDL